MRNSNQWVVILFILVLLSSCGNRIDSNIEKELKECKEKLALNELKKDQLEANKQLVVKFFTEAFIELKIEALHKYIGDNYIQHDPNIADGKQALINAVSGWLKHMKPNQVEIKRVFGENNLVFIHTKNNISHKDMSLMHVFRVENNKIVEHWMTVQEVPVQSANNNTMF